MIRRRLASIMSGVALAESKRAIRDRAWMRGVMLCTGVAREL